MKAFSELGLSLRIQQALTQEGYATPTPIQERAIPHAIAGQDVLGSAQTGTGKTAAFTLPILDHIEKINRKAIPNRPFALILTPTRELASQVSDSLATYGRHLKFHQAVVFGGVGKEKQIRALKRGTHVVVATPGRLLDLIRQGHVDLSRLEMFVLDEADRMLDMGFLPDLKRIIKHLPAQRQSLFFSATLPPKIVALAESLLTDQVKIDVTPTSKCVDRIAQRILFVRHQEKQDVLQQILSEKDVGRALVFTKTKRGANQVTQKLLEAGVSASVIHGNKSQAARQRALQQFRENRVRVLIATDVAARGIDVDQVTHVVNFDVPTEVESYVHRIGRTARAGADGIAMTLCSNQEHRELQAIEKFLGERIPVDPAFGTPERGLRQSNTRQSKKYPKSSRRQSGTNPTRKRLCPNKTVHKSHKVSTANK